MGLDMYLFRTLKKSKKKRSVEVMYWRKANQIHKWFVDSVQNGEDDCNSYTVTIDDLITLRNLCQKIINDDRVSAKELLPIQSGFFFGSTDYDEYYFNQLEFTITKLDELINEDKSNYNYSYNSSW